MESVTVAGTEVPTLGFGTARLTGDDCAEAVVDALDIGYRHLDTAQMYDNEESVGRGIDESDVDREEIFLTTKLHPSNLAREDALESFQASLDRLGEEYVDLLLIHSPGSTPIEETVGAMNDLQEEGAVRHIGVSNFSTDQVEAAIEASETPILTNQLEYHPYEDRRDHLRFCIENEVLLTAYSPLDEGGVADDGTLTEIGERYDKTPSQVALRWLLQQPMVAPIPKAASPDHRRENVDVFDFDLSEGEMERIFEPQGGLVEEVRSLLDD